MLVHTAFIVRVHNTSAITSALARCYQLPRRGQPEIDSYRLAAATAAGS